MGAPSTSHKTPRKYRIQPGDSLSSIAMSQLGEANRWADIARANGLHAPYKLLIGQELYLPRPIIMVPKKFDQHPAAQPRAPVPDRPTPSNDRAGVNKPTWTVMARGSLFVILRQIDANGKLVRKVLALPPRDIATMIVNHPEQFGFHPRNMDGVVSLGEHALGNTLSPYISASTKPGGAPNFSGKPWYIDIAKAKKGGAVIHSTEEIIRDLDRIYAASTNQLLRDRINRLKGVIDSVEGEVLIEGRVAASAVQSAEAAAREMALFKTLGHAGRAVSVVGVLFTAYDLEQASVRSVRAHSIRPIAAESVRQTFGWGGGFAGGFALGAALGIETGPGAIVTGLVGGLIGGIAGYAAGNRLAEEIDPGH